MTTPAIDPKRLKRLLRSLIDIYSPSGKEDEAIDYLFTTLKRAGLAVTRQMVDEDRDNLLVLPPDGEAELLFVGHVDTVPAYDYETYETDFEGDTVWGLGATDMKGGCAAMIEAFMAWQDSGRELPRAALALVVGEEENGDGTAALVREYHFPWAIVGEPTDMGISMSHYGYVELELRAGGKRMHASLAEQAPNAIKAMLSTLSHLMPMLDSYSPGLVYNLRDMTSSSSGFAVPEWCEAWLDLHLPPGVAPDAFVAAVEEAIEPVRAKIAPATLSAIFTTVHAGYTLPAKGPHVERLQTLAKEMGLPFNERPFPSHSDAALLWEAGIKPAIVGPGKLAVAHTRDEAVSMAQVEQAARFYLAILEQLSAAN